MTTRKNFPRGNPVTDILDEWVRDDHGYSQIEMAERIGVTKSANCFISQLRSGRSKMPITKVIPLARLLEQDPKPMVIAILNEYYPELRDALAECDLLRNLDNNSLGNLKDVVKSRKKAV